jgi:hypothetical protein
VSRLSVGVDSICTHAGGDCAWARWDIRLSLFVDISLSHRYTLAAGLLWEVKLFHQHFVHWWPRVDSDSSGNIVVDWVADEFMVSLADLGDFTRFPPPYRGFTKFTTTYGEAISEFHSCIRLLISQYTVNFFFFSKLVLYSEQCKIFGSSFFHFPLFAACYLNSTLNLYLDFIFVKYINYSWNCLWYNGWWQIQFGNPDDLYILFFHRLSIRMRSLIFETWYNFLYRMNFLLAHPINYSTFLLF